MNPTAATARSRPEPLARQHHPRAARQRHAAPLHRRSVGHRPDLEPDDLRRGDRRHRRLRRRHPRARCSDGKSGEALFFELALEDLRRAADLFRPASRRDRRRRWLGVAGSVAAARLRHAQAPSRRPSRSTRRPTAPNLFIKIPGTPAGMPAIEESIFAGVPINVTLLFSREQYLAAAEAYLRGIERRIAAGLDPRCASVASLFVSRWDKAVAARCPPTLRNRLGIAVAAAHLPGLPRAARLAALADAWRPPAPLRNGCSGPAPAPRTRRVRTYSTSRRSPRPTRSTRCRRRPCRRSPITARSARSMRPDGGDAEVVLARVRRGRHRRRRAGGATSSRKVRESFVEAWKDLLSCIESKAAALREPGTDGRAGSMTALVSSPTLSLTQRPAWQSAARPTTGRSATCICANSSPRIPIGRSG